jgi:acyl carrier protein
LAASAAYRHNRRKGGLLRHTDTNHKIRNTPVTSDIRQTVRAFIQDNFLIGAEAQVDDGESLLQLQIVDSTGFLEIVAFIESTFDIRVSDDEMVPENLESIDNIAAYVGRKLPA